MGFMRLLLMFCFGVFVGSTLTFIWLSLLITSELGVNEETMEEPQQAIVIASRQSST